ncbi:MAG TPA: ROK family protein [Anaerolineae bacterium]|nr:ROK family protein [Anaerolineae bacterium]
MEILGIDIGGSGIKGAPVDVDTGTLTAERYRVETPQPSTPDAVADAVADVVRHFKWKGPLGCTFPAVIKEGVAYSAANVDRTWIGANGQKLLKKKTRCPAVVLLNDADAAGMAEMTFGAGQGQPGVVFVLTFGTGIGSAVFVNGVLLPNTELGHLPLRGKDAEQRASDRVRAEKGWSWKKWARRVNEYLAQLDALFSPDLYVVGGGVSRKFDKFGPYLTARAEIVPAQLLNEAGIVGAALAAKAIVSV